MEPTGEGTDPFDLAEAADRDAVQRVLDGDVEAFAGVVRRHGARLVGLCARMAGNRDLGEELAQEALARAYASLGAFRGDSRFGHWLTRIALNGCRDWLKAGARAERPADLSGEELATWRHPEREASARELSAALADALGRLPPKYREAFTLFHVENLAYQDMRAVTGVSVNALKVRVHRARRMLARELARFLEGG